MIIILIIKMQFSGYFISASDVVSVALHYDNFVDLKLQNIIIEAFDAILTMHGLRHL